MIEVDLLATLVPVFIIARFLLANGLASQVRGAVFVLVCIVAIIGRYMEASTELALILVVVLLCGTVILASIQSGRGVDNE